MAQYQVLCEQLQTEDGKLHPRGMTIELSDSEAQICLALRAVTPIDPMEQYRLELSQVQQREQELQTLISQGSVPASAPATPTNSASTSTVDTTPTATDTTPTANGAESA